MSVRPLCGVTQRSPFGQRYHWLPNASRCSTDSSIAMRRGERADKRRVDFGSDISASDRNQACAELVDGAASLLD